MFGWFKKRRKVDSKKEDEKINFEQLKSEVPSNITVSKDGNQITAVTNLDVYDKESKEELLQSIRSNSKLPFFNGVIEHGFAKKAVNTTSICPKCEGNLQQHFSDIIYTNGERPRVSTSPFGYYCESCPTVVIDIAQLRTALPKGMQFHGIVGIETKLKKLNLFKTWNREKPVIILDEYQNITGVSTRAEIGDDYNYASYDKSIVPKSAIKRKSKNRKKNKSASKSRKKNRKKK